MPFLTSQAPRLPVPPEGGTPAPFSLQAGSPAINAGTDVGVTTDIEGTARDAQPDIGAYEKH